MATGPHLGAVFTERAAAETAVEELRRLGLADPDLGIAIHRPDGYAFEEDAEVDVIHGVERGIALGAPIGAAAGMTIMALVVPGIGTLGVGGVLAAGGLTGAFGGTFLGAFLGLAAQEHELEEEWDWERVPLAPGDTMVVVAGHDHPDDVEVTLVRNGGRIVARPQHVH